MEKEKEMIDSKRNTSDREERERFLTRA